MTQLRNIFKTSPEAHWQYYMERTKYSRMDGYAPLFSFSHVLPSRQVRCFETNSVRIVIVMFCIHLLLGLFYDTACQAESKSEMIKHLRNKSCIENVSRTGAYLSRLQRFQTDINQLLEQIEITSSQALVIGEVRSAETTLTNLSISLANHNRSKQSICEQMNQGSGSAAGEYPEGYEGLLKSEKIKRLKVDYCTDVRKNGELIRMEIPMLKKTMQRMFRSNHALIQQLQDPWSETIPIVDDLYNEQMMAIDICTSIENGISKSELIRKSIQGFKSSGQLPFLWYLIKYD
jgi:hypothetical protein